jgi:hypothetical protein
MKKFYLVALILFSMCHAGHAQAFEENVQYDKKKQPAIAIEYSYPAQAVENAFVQRMEKLGYKAKEEKGILNKDRGFLVFRNAYVTDISQERMDYIIKVDRKSRKEDDESVLYLILQKNGTNTLDKMEAYDVGQAKSFLNNMLPDIEAAHLELQIKEQEEVVAKAEKKLKDLQKDRADLEKRLSDNEKSQDATIKDIDAQRSSLETLRGRRKNN